MVYIDYVMFTCVCVCLFVCVKCNPFGWIFFSLFINNNNDQDDDDDDDEKSGKNQADFPLIYYCCCCCWMIIMKITLNTHTCTV